MKLSLNAHGNDVGISLRWKLAWAGTLLVTSLARAELLPTLGALTLPPGSTQASLGERMRLFGMPVAIRIFEIPASVDRAAHMLTQRYAGLSNIGVYPGRLVLSGDIDQQFWVISLTPAGPAATRGTVSVSRSTAQGLPLGAADAANSPFPASAAVTDDGYVMVSHAWLPSTAHLRMQLEQDADGVTSGHTLHQVWTIPASVSSTRRTIHRNLLRDQWQLHSETQGTSQWQRRKTSIQLTITAIDSGTGLLLLQHDGATF